MTRWMDRLRAQRLRGPLLAVLLVLMASELGSLGLGWSVFATVAQASFVALCVVAIPHLSIREAALASVAVGLSLVVWFTQDNGSALIASLELAAFFGAFIATLTAMRDIAARSRSVLAVGHFLTNQSPGRRFYATAFGGHLLGVFLNFGAVSLMSPLIQKSALSADGTPSPDLERRQISALIRGFAWVLLWAPTTLSQAVLLTIFTEVSWFEILSIGLPTAIVMILVGRLYDRFEWRATPLPVSGAVLDPPLRALYTVGGICIGLIGATMVSSLVFQVSIAQTLLFVVPVITVLWHVFQGQARAPKAILQRLGQLQPIFLGSSPALARAAIALGLSGYIGRLAGQALPVERLSQSVDLASVPGWVFLAVLPILITLGGQIALSPILLVVFLGEVLRSVDVLPTGQLQILFALSFGWALSMTASPNATATLLISATCNIPPTRLTWAWNLRYGLLCYGLALPLFMVIA